MKKATFIIAALLLHTYHCLSQNHEIYDNNIKSLQVVADDNWLSMPVIQLNTDERINISFDDLTHTYHRYAYKLVHCKADWKESDQLFSSDYIDGFADGNTIDDSQESVNTNILYTHYKFCIPNSQCNIKLSGNYKLTVYDENNNNQPVLTACFMVINSKVSISMSVTSNTDIDMNNKHQQVSFEVNYSQLKAINPQEQIKTFVLQNGRWDNVKVPSRPQFISAQVLKWDHNKDLIFEAGNEYHKFEFLDVTHPTMGIDHIAWDGNDYHVYPFVCEPRYNYIYDEDANGAFYIRNSNNIENDYASDYAWIHYRLMTDPLPTDDVYINGAWTINQFSPQYKMTYNAAEKCYECKILQKQGYYSYQFLCRNNGKSLIMPSEGSFYQTENKYQILVYYKGQGERTDQLVGFRQLQYK